MTDPWHEGHTMSSDTPSASDGARPGLRRGFLAWIVFILAISVVLATVGGCVTMMYGPALTGG